MMSRCKYIMYHPPSQSPNSRLSGVDPSIVGPLSRNRGDLKSGTSYTTHVTSLPLSLVVPLFQRDKGASDKRGHVTRSFTQKGGGSLVPYPSIRTSSVFLCLHNLTRPVTEHPEPYCCIGRSLYQCYGTTNDTGCLSYFSHVTS